MELLERFQILTIINTWTG